MRFVNIGFGNVVNISKIVSVVSPESAPIKRIVQMSKARIRAHQAYRADEQGGFHADRRDLRQKM